MVLFLLLDKFLPVQEHEVMWNVNHDMDNIVTPVDAESFDELLGGLSLHLNHLIA